MNKGAVISTFLRALANAVEAIPDGELDELLRRDGLRGLLGRGRKRPASSKTPKPRPKEEAAALMAKLVLATTRNEAAAILERDPPTRNVLVEAAKTRNVHILKQDTNEVLRTKLIENVVGSRLDSAAIRGDRTDTQGG